MNLINNEYTYVHLANATNSTMFTNCCGTAICNNQIKCPSCGIEVYPNDPDISDYKTGMLRWQYAFKK